MGIQFEAGALHRGAFRRYLEEAKFINPTIDYVEIKGFLNLSSVFHIKGDDAVVCKIGADINQYIYENKQSQND